MRDVIVGEALPGYRGLHMVDRVEGPRPMLVGRRLQVSDIVRAVQDNDGSEAGAAEWYEIDRGIVETAMRYYRDHQEQVDTWIREEDEYDERAEAEWKRQHGHKFE
jgi:uncharacterized protein (DUF433 family)